MVLSIVGCNYYKKVWCLIWPSCAQVSLVSAFKHIDKVKISYIFINYFFSLWSYQFFSSPNKYYLVLVTQRILWCRAVGCFFIVGGLSKNVGDHGWPTKKLNLHLLKHPKTVPKNEIWTRK